MRLRSAKARCRSAVSICNLDFRKLVARLRRGTAALVHDVSLANAVASRALTPSWRRDAGAYSATGAPCGARAASRPPGLPFGTRVRRFWARSALRDPPLPCRSTRTGSTWDALFASEAVATHDTAAARATAIGRQGLLDLHPPTGFLPGAVRCHVRCWIQTPRREQRRTIIGPRQDGGDKREPAHLRPTSSAQGPQARRKRVAMPALDPHNSRSINSRLPRRCSILRVHNTHREPSMALPPYASGRASSSFPAWALRPA
jgi:hypothetical protein